MVVGSDGVITIFSFVEKCFFVLFICLFLRYLLYLLLRCFLFLLPPHLNLSFVPPLPSCFPSRSSFELQTFSQVNYLIPFVTCILTGLYFIILCWRFVIFAFILCWGEPEFFLYCVWVPLIYICAYNIHICVSICGYKYISNVSK